MLIATSGLQQKQRAVSGSNRPTPKRVGIGAHPVLSVVLSIPGIIIASQALCKSPADFVAVRPRM